MGVTPNPFHTPLGEDTPRFWLPEHVQDLHELTWDMPLNTTNWGQYGYKNSQQQRKTGGE